MENVLPFNPTQYPQSLNARESCICFWTSHKGERMPGKDAAHLRGKECLCYNIYMLWQGRNLSAA